MEKITVGQFLGFTNVYVPIYIEDEFHRYDWVSGVCGNLATTVLNESQLKCPIDYFRNVDGGHFDDDEKRRDAIVIGIGIENYEKYFGKF